MEVGRGLEYPRQTMLDDVEIDTSSYVVVKVNMVHDNSKDLKLKVLPNDTTLTMQDAITRRVQWRQTSIDVDPSAAASTSTTPSQPNTSTALIVPEARLSPSLNLEQLRMSPIREQLCSALIQEQTHPPLILEHQQKSPIEEQSRRSPPWTWSNPSPTPDVGVQAKVKILFLGTHMMSIQFWA
jgi:hypothetical protein